MKYFPTAALIVAAAAAAGIESVQAWSSSSTTTTSHRLQYQQQLKMATSDLEDGQVMMTRKSMLQTLVKGGGAAVAVAFLPRTQAAYAAGAVETLPSGVTYEVIKSGDGPKPDLGELVAIRFAAYCGDRKIDDIFDTPEPYYTRLGSGGLLKGVEETLPLMRLGDRWKLTIPGKLAFGPKGRPSSAGKPRIPADAEIVFEVEMVGLPGKEPELIELIGSVDD